MECPTCQTNNPEDSKFCKACATPLPHVEKFGLTKTIKTPSRKSLVGTTIAGKYKIITELGKGGMGIVYKAEDIRLRRTAALKFLPPELTRDEEARERFIQEARAASALDHNNICTIYEIADSEDEHFFIAMAYYEGQSLKEKIKHGPVDEREATNIAIQAALGLAKAHSRGIVHRDIKPANMIVTQDGVVKVLDFGLAKLTGQVRLTRKGTTMGTVAYMSPEQAQGREVDHRTDIWSLGVVIYEMLTGELPFQGEREQSLMYSILNEEPDPLKKVRPGLPDAFERILATALAKKPEDRYQKADDLLDDLCSVTEGLKPLKAKAKSFQKRILGIRRSLFFAGAATFVLLSTVAGVLLLTGRSSAIESIAILPIENLTQEEGLDHICKGIPDEIINRLLSVKSLRLPSRVAVEPYVGKPLKEIGNQLKVSKVLASTLELTKDGLRINAAITEVDRGLPLWTKSLDFKRTELNFLREEMTRCLIDGLNLRLEAGNREMILRDYTKNDKAYEAYLRGEMQSEVPGFTTWNNAAKYYQLALEEDPDYGPAHASLAQLYQWMGGQEVMPVQEAYPLAKYHAIKALEIDENLAAAHSAHASVLAFVDWNWAEAEKEFEKAISINPRDPRLHLAYGMFLGSAGLHSRAIVEAKRAIELDPMNVLYHYQLGWSLNDAGRFKEAQQEYQEVLKRFPASPPYYAGLASSYAGQKKYDEAITAGQHAVDISTDDWKLVAQANMAESYSMAGEREKALEILEQLKKQNAPDGFIVQIYIRLGDLDKAFEMLESAFRDRKQWLFSVLNGSASQCLEGDPRYEDLLRRTGLDI